MCIRDSNRGTPHSEAPAAYAHVVRETHAHAAYFEINVSSPNTPGLRALQNRDHLRAIIGAIRAETSRPLWIKIAPDLTQPAIDEVIDVAVTHGIDAIAAVNTTNDPAVKAALGPRWVDEAGGVSGPPLRARATEVVAYIAAQGVVDVIGVGGVTDFESLLEKLQAGAKAVGIYTGFVTQGPALPSLLLHQLDAWLGERTLTQAFNH
ncbi:MAG: dihydroorotate dehydrogenase (quinone), partial [Chloroflexi bacterium]|nr:dihydroorotate dehydrogenase (quinone) [Chloroflexota bacterium]